MVNSPKVSLVTPSYNQGQFVERTVRSVLFQDYPNIEYIFMDGGSTDGTMAAVAPYLHRFGYWCSKRDEGQAAAVHDGLEKASGDIMGYLNSDDLLAPGAITKVVNYFRNHPEVDAVYSHRVFIDENDVINRISLLPPHSNYLVSRWDWLPQETCFWRRGLFEQAGNVDPRMAFALDYDLFVRFMRKGKLARMNAFLGAFRWHEDSKSATQFETVGRTEIEIIKQRYDVRPRLGDPVIGRVFIGLAICLGYAYVHFPYRGILPFLGSTGVDYNVLWSGRLRGG
jgi:glycosyltransferase involved in cell wall biosynthesis